MARRTDERICHAHLLFMLSQGQLDVAEWLLSVIEISAEEAVTVQNKQNNTPMHFACRGGHLEVCCRRAQTV
jgi:ankyrin repeat protein